jgi:TIR domain
MSARARRRPSAFLSYRRSDTDALAGRLKDRLEVSLPGWDIFMDVASVEPGADFRAAIDDRIARAAVVIALIGKRWAGDDGKRIHDPDDLVRHEIRLALTRGIRLIPVLVNDALMPKARDLPDDIALLAQRNAIELRHSRFEDDFGNLAKSIGGRDAGASGNRSSYFSLRALRHGLIGAALALIAIIVVLALHLELTGRSISERIGDDGATLVIPMAVLLGAVVGYWRIARRRS